MQQLPGLVRVDPSATNITNSQILTSLPAASYVFPFFFVPLLCAWDTFRLLQHLAYFSLGRISFFPIQCLIILHIRANVSRWFDRSRKASGL